MANRSTSKSLEILLNLLQSHPLSLKRYDYGTAGFRYAANVLPGVMLRVGISMSFLWEQDPSMTGDLGVMVTASHNDESYNGVKICQPDGSMISPTQEALLVQWVNERDLQVWKQALSQRLATASPQRVLHVGRDTRCHSPTLSNLLIQAAMHMGITVREHGIVTTPMLHHIVLHSNPTLLPHSSLGLPPAPSRSGYLWQIATAHSKLMRAISTTRGSRRVLRVDGACGVGYPAACDLQATWSQVDPHNAEQSFALDVWNGPHEGPLNVQCGSEHVQKQLTAPDWHGTHADLSDGSYCCSVDGDADRIVFFATSPTNTNLTLLDGDKIAVLIAHAFQQNLLRHLPPNTLSMGVVQTAYANGASTDYIQNKLQIPVVITKTGVKHLHHAAQQFDIGIYFEANGHGTVIFGPKYHEVAMEQSKNDSSLATILQWLPQLINPAVGDALSDLLLVDLLLLWAGGWTLQDWSTKLYHDLPSRQVKVRVQDRSMVVCNAQETKCLEPKSLQPLLDSCSSKFEKGRCFVRPSGTEDVVRVYAEATTREAADRLATQAAQLVYDECVGVGPMPKI